VSQADNHLRWIKRNRKEVRIPERVGSTLRALLPQGSIRKQSLQESIIGILTQRDEVELRDQILAAKLYNGVLYLKVRDPATLYRFRLLWEQRLLDVLQAEQGYSNIQAIRFTTRGYKH
jgi:hypothetical protein